MEALDQEGSSAELNEFKSPRHLLLRFFRKSQQKWKEKAKERRARIKDLEHKVRDIDESRANWKSKMQQLDGEKKALEERLRVAEAEREQLRARVEELESKKA